MSEIIPAIIAKDKEELQRKLSLVEGLVSWAQIDVTDGVFTPATTWPYVDGVISNFQFPISKLNLEVHLMVKNPEHTIANWLASPVKRILLHYESTAPERIAELIGKITASGKEAGLVLKLETPLSVLDDLFHASRSLFVQERSDWQQTAVQRGHRQSRGFTLHVVQLMGIAEIGYYGHGFEPYALDRIKALRAKYPDVTIEVDGGVNLENASVIARAGADNLISGSAIFKTDDVKGAIDEFKSILRSTP
ncbi:hypothetical protein HY250_02160 [Candidatus Azambacteria bacterium]|nr:hypothetical protein [Candidatus Azambacteria bacterium]MBI3685186.1 hypothetical protein [Candidatus Azambacteria bacterium]